MEELKLKKRRIRAIVRSMCKQYKCNIYDEGMYYDVWERMSDNNPTRIRIALKSSK